MVTGGGFIGLIFLTIIFWVITILAILGTPGGTCSFQTEGKNLKNIKKLFDD